MSSLKSCAVQQNCVEKMVRRWLLIVRPLPLLKDTEKVCQFVAVARAREERCRIQERDHMFKVKTHFVSKPLTTKLNIVVEGQPVFDTKDIPLSGLFSDPLHSPMCYLAITICYLLSFGNANQILDTDICVEKIECALRILKMGKSSGLDGILPEHIVYGGEVLKVWLKKVYNRILTLEEFPDCFKEGVVVPIYKRQSKNPLLVNSYCGITISSVLSKVLEVILLQRLSSILNGRAFPDQLQTAYQKSISCIDATFATQETLTCHLHDGGQPYLCLFDMEKGFDSVEIPVLLRHLYNTGINGKFWRIIKSWYSNSFSRVHINNQLSEPFTVERGVMQGSVPSF